MIRAIKHTLIISFEYNPFGLLNFVPLFPKKKVIPLFRLYAPLFPKKTSYHYFDYMLMLFVVSNMSFEFRKLKFFLSYNHDVVTSLE